MWRRLLSHTSKATKSYDIVTQGLEILKNLDHRGAVGADPLQGDGAGILIQIPDAPTGKSSPPGASSCRLAGDTVWAWCSCPRRSPAPACEGKRIACAIRAEGRC